MKFFFLEELATTSSYRSSRSSAQLVIKNLPLSFSSSARACISNILTLIKRREATIVNVKCPCGASYQILLLEGICCYKLV
ncbi:hypothetical protein OWV82_006538 [Melia azedarach]|uniref:Uncharacterized protein n=1 Tax=Melia azedarach TaxID=155640 RepID=A0ACC1YIC6_MELAZ|nr:hypothetical protein OWV82_006538 [Melia azedarach]